MREKSSLLRPAGQTANQPALQLVAKLILKLTPKQNGPSRWPLIPLRTTNVKLNHTSINLINSIADLLVTQMTVA